MSSPLDASHLRREVRTALELALAAFAPASVLDPLARSAGYLEGLSEFPHDSPAVKALATRVATEAGEALRAWERWRLGHLEKQKS